MPDTLIQVAPQVWVFPRDEDPNRIQPNVGIIVAGGQTVLIDGGNSPRHARRILLSLDDIAAPAVSHVIYTHSHWDHVFGAMVFGAPAIAHDLCRKQLAEMATKPWGHAYIQEEIMRFPAREAGLRALGRTIEDWRNFRIVVPEITMSKTLQVYLGDLTIEIEHVGGVHAPESVIVRIPEQRVLFTGDCYYPPPIHLRRPDDALDATMIESLLDDQIDVYIDGHGLPRSRDEFAALISGGRNGELS
jgi:glyoxylase-like metal-dependent hydrolase (beta-lactamase superfamily II)